MADDDITRLLRDNTSAIQLYRANLANPQEFDDLRMWVRRELDSIQSGFASTDAVVKILAKAIRTLSEATSGNTEIIKGLDGATGPQGPQGPQGPPGDDTEVYRRIRWLNVWDAGITYEAYDQVREAGWTMAANKRTTDYPSPRAVGTPFPLYDGTLTPTSVSAKVVAYGNRYSLTVDGYITSYRVDVTAGNDYEVYLVEDPLGANIRTQLASFPATTTGWRTFSISPIIIKAGATFDLVAVTTEPPATPTPVTLSYDYTNPQNPAAPAVGEISHSRAQADLMQVSYTDQAGDQTATISGLSAGDTVEGAGVLWTVLVNVPNTGFASLTVSPAANGAPIGVQDFLFNTTVPTDIEYGFDTDYWLTSPFNVKGLLAIDAPYDTNPPNDTAYGVDITAQNIEVSDDWDIVAAGEAVGGTETALSAREVSWVNESSQLFDEFTATTTDNTWVEFDRRPFSMMPAERGEILAKGTRTDAVGFGVVRVAILGYWDGAAVIADSDIVYRTGPATNNVRVVADGTDLVFEVRGGNMQAWDWDITVFFTEIE